MVSTVSALNTFVEFAPVRIAAPTNQLGTYSNGTLNNGVGATFTYTSTGFLVIDGFPINSGESILLFAQNAPYENGIYICINPGGVGIQAVLQRRGDLQSIEQFKAGYHVSISSGIALQGGYATLVEPLPAAIGRPVVPDANDIIFAGSVTPAPGAFLQIANNLSDVSSATDSLDNINALSRNGSILASGETGYPVIFKSVTVTAAGLGGGAQTLLANTGSNRYVIFSIWLDVGGFDFVTGDRDLLISDGTNEFGTIAAADLQNLSNSFVRNSTITPISQKSVGGMPITAQYTGGTSDYVNGTATITIAAILDTSGF